MKFYLNKPMNSRSTCIPIGLIIKSHDSVSDKIFLRAALVLFILFNFSMRLLSNPLFLHKYHNQWK